MHLCRKTMLHKFLFLITPFCYSVVYFIAGLSLGFVQILLNLNRDIIMADSSASSSASYIHMVHYLIENCLIFNMTKEESMETLYKHAKIIPVITSTVWNELEKENKEFFDAYSGSQSKINRMSEEEKSCMIRKMISK